MYALSFIGQLFFIGAFVLAIFISLKEDDYDTLTTQFLGMILYLVSLMVYAGSLQFDWLSWGLVVIHISLLIYMSTWVLSTSVVEQIMSFFLFTVFYMITYSYYIYYIWNLL